jgi:CheY-like chemotaxis protein
VPRTILVVDDNEDAAATLADLLALRGHRVSTASTGAAAVNAAVSERPSVVICDVGLPDMSGHDVIRAIRSREDGARVFAVALTGYAQPKDREAALAAGFDAHLAKPTQLDELDAMLRSLA